jgi:hypothetical protein
MSEKLETTIFNCPVLLLNKPAGALKRKIEYPEGLAVHIGMNYEANRRPLRLVSTMPLWCGLGMPEVGLKLKSSARVKNYFLVLLVDFRLSPVPEYRTQGQPKFSSFIADCDSRFPGMLPHVELSRAYSVLGLQEVSYIVKMRVSTRLG